MQTVKVAAQVLTGARRPDVTPTAIRGAGAGTVSPPCGCWPQLHGFTRSLGGGAAGLPKKYYRAGPRESSSLAALPEELGDDARPARLMAGADARAVVAVEVLVEEGQRSARTPGSGGRAAGFPPRGSVGKRRLGILVEVLHVGMGGRRIE